MKKKQMKELLRDRAERLVEMNRKRMTLVHERDDARTAALTGLRVQAKQRVIIDALTDAAVDGAEASENADGLAARIAELMDVPVECVQESALSKAAHIAREAFERAADVPRVTLVAYRNDRNAWAATPGPGIATRFYRDGIYGDSAEEVDAKWEAREAARNPQPKFHVGQRVRVTEDAAYINRGVVFTVAEVKPRDPKRHAYTETVGDFYYLGAGVPHGVWEAYLEAMPIPPRYAANEFSDRFVILQAEDGTWPPRPTIAGPVSWVPTPRFINEHPDHRANGDTIHMPEKGTN